MSAEPASWTRWPQQVEPDVMRCMADAHFIMALERGPAAWWQQWQQQRLADLLAWLRTHGWWMQWQHSAPKAASRVTGLDGMPIMQRTNFRALVESHKPVTPTDHGPLFQMHTSGSVGVPVPFWRSDMALRITRHHYWADNQRQGRDLRRATISITGRVGAHDGQARHGKSHPWFFPGDHIEREVTQFSTQEHARWLCTQKADYLATLPATLSQMMSVIADEHLRPPPIQQILTAFQTVDPLLRERARQTFGASIRDRYSCEEVGALALQCPQSDEHYHVAVANAIVEVVDDDGNPCANGVRGNVLVTGLNQWASPAIRYAIGDVACAHVSCPGCGASAPALSDLLGRKAKLLSSPVRGLRFVRVLAEHWLACAPVREHLLVQTGETALRAELVLDRALQAAEKDALLAMLRKEIGEEFTFEVVQVPSIPMPNFKREEFVREIP